MISLDTSTRKLQIVLGGAITTNQLHCSVYFYDVPAKTKPNDFSEYPIKAQYSLSNSTTDVDICDAPPASTSRHLVAIYVQNRDTVAATVTIKKDDGGTEHNIVVKSLLAGETLFITKDGIGRF